MVRISQIETILNHGISQFLIMPHIPEQNGYVEQKHSTFEK